MQPAGGGRICGTCTKLIRDFSGCSWEEIERVQRENNYAVCGMYSRRQLEHWGQTPAPRKFGYAAPLVMATAVVSLLHPAPGKAHARVPAPQFARQPGLQAAVPESPAEPRDSARTVVLSGKVIDAESQQPLPGVNVLLKGTTTGTVTGHQGEFQLEVDASELDSAAALVFSFIGFRKQEVPVSPATPGRFTLRMVGDLTGLNAFYVVQPSWPKRVWWKVKGVFGGKPH
jgi:hypothetical protein